MDLESLNSSVKIPKSFMSFIISDNSGISKFSWLDLAISFELKPNAISNRFFIAEVACVIVMITRKRAGVHLPAPLYGLGFHRPAKIAISTDQQMHWDETSIGLLKSN